MPDTRDTNRAVARQLLSAWNKHGETYMPKDLAHPQMVRYFPQPVGMASASGQPAVASALPRAAIQGQNYQEDMIIANGEYAFVAWHMTGVHAGQLYGRAATGGSVTVYGADILRVADGKVIEHWDYYSKSRVQALGQLGLLDADMQRYLISNHLLGRNRKLS
jgi:predicted SnoaL-like aldol condensation-catalyzing enzyme